MPSPACPCQHLLLSFFGGWRQSGPLPLLIREVENGAEACSVQFSVTRHLRAPRRLELKRPQSSSQRTQESGPREAKGHTHLCQASQQGGCRRPEASRPLAEPKLAKCSGLFCLPHCIRQDSPRNRAKSSSLPLFSRGGTGASVTLPLIIWHPHFLARGPSGEAQTQQVSGGLQSGVAGAVWVSVSVLWAWGHLLGFTESPPAGALPSQSPGQSQAPLGLVAYTSS